LAAHQPHPGQADQTTATIRCAAGIRREHGQKGQEYSRYCENNFGLKHVRKAPPPPRFDHWRGEYHTPRPPPPTPPTPTAPPPPGGGGVPARGRHALPWRGGPPRGGAPPAVHGPPLNAAAQPAAISFEPEPTAPRRRVDPSLTHGHPQA